MPTYESMTQKTENTQGSLRVVHLFRAPLGGLFRHVCDLIEGQAQKGLALGLICDSWQPGSQADTTLEKLKPFCVLGIHPVPMSRSFSWSDYLRAVWLRRSKHPPAAAQGETVKGGRRPEDPLAGAAHH